MCHLFIVAKLMPNLNKTFLILAIVVVAVALVLGFTLTGSPARQRAIASDERRVNDLQQIATRIDDYARLKGDNNKNNVWSPKTLEEVFADEERYGGKIPRNDPFTQEPYQYKKMEGKDYQLCATFETNTSKTANQGSPNYYGAWRGPKVWEHPVGNHCFTMSVEKSPYDGSPIVYPVM